MQGGHRVRRRAFDRQRNMERGPLPFCTFHRDGPSVSIDHVFDDLRPQTGSTGFTADRLVCEQAVPDFRRHAFAGIDHGEHDLVP